LKSINPFEHNSCHMFKEGSPLAERIDKKRIEKLEELNYK
jgi:hypothetical protein